jgi:NAD-dependent DNA ligase
VNHLSNGLMFRVFQTVKGGKKVYKGRAEVVKVDETNSEVRIVEEVDPLNPIVQGDMVSSPFYDPKANPVFVFAGSELDSKEVTREYVVQKMKNYGAQIRNKVDVNTDFLVALKNFENTPEYKSAREFGVTILREKDLLTFLGQ